MDAHKLQLKIFLAPDAAVGLDRAAFVPVFHRWIKEHTLPEMLIDVASYVHVPEGPSVALIGHGSDYFVDEGGGRVGLLYSRKRAGVGGSAAERLADLARRTLHAAALLEKDAAFGGKLRFVPGELLFRVNDRLHAPASDATFAALRPELEAFAAKLYGAGAFELTRVGGPKELFAVRIVSAKPPTLDALLERAGGPPGADASLVT
jgi:hypothetical protein